MSLELEEAKLQLQLSLKDNSSKYWELLKLWHQKKISKDEFDRKAKQFLGEEKIHLHNQFFLSFLLKSYLPETEKNKLNPLQSQLPGFHFTQMSTHPLKVNSLAIEDALNLSHCSTDLYLPSLPRIRTRLQIDLIQFGIKTFEDNIGKLIQFAQEDFIKGIVYALVLKRCGWVDKGVPHYFSHHVPLRMIKNRETFTNHENFRPIKKPKLNSIYSVEILEKYSTGEAPKVSPHINLFEVYELLREHTYLVPSHSVLTQSIEKCASSLFHEGQNSSL